MHLFQITQGFVLFVKFNRYICIGNVPIFMYAICYTKRDSINMFQSDEDYSFINF